MSFNIKPKDKKLTYREILNFEEVTAKESNNKSSS